MWESADTTAIQLVLAARPQDLKVKRLVEVPEVTGRELHSQRHLPVGWHDPPEIIQPANDHVGFSSKSAFFGPREDRTAALGGVPPCWGQEWWSIGPCRQNSPVPICCRDSCTLNVGLQHQFPWAAQRPT